MTETALAGVVVAALAGLFAGRAWAVARRGAGGEGDASAAQYMYLYSEIIRHKRLPVDLIRKV